MDLKWPITGTLTLNVLQKYNLQCTSAKINIVEIVKHFFN